MDELLPERDGGVKVVNEPSKMAAEGRPGRKSGGLDSSSSLKPALAGERRYLSLASLSPRRGSVSCFGYYPGLRPGLPAAARSRELV